MNWRRIRAWFARRESARRNRPRVAGDSETRRHRNHHSGPLARVATLGAALYGDRGYFYIRLGRFAEAFEDFNAGMQLDAANPRYRFGAGRAQALLGNYAAAADLYGEAIKLSPRDPTFYLARAEAYIRLDQPRLARADYDQALKIKLPRPIDSYFATLGRGFAAL